jgi:hypothetical protein
MVAITWAHDTAQRDLEGQVRVRRGGQWSPWQSLAFEPTEGPAATEESSVRDGTAPLWVGASDGVRARLISSAGATPRDVKVVMIDPGVSAYDQALAGNNQRYASGEQRDAGQARGGARRFIPMPRIVTRKQWGADPALLDNCSPPRYGTTAKAVFVHHTAGSNSYSEADAPAIVRSVLAYHTQAQGWCDIGYNFLVDRFGNVYEGRRGGMRRPVRGAHSGDYNVNSVGVSLMGKFSAQPTTRPMRHALVRLAAWRLGSSYHRAHRRVQIYGRGFATISGHRDAMSTDCPGGYVYNWLPRLRNRVADRMGDFRTPIYHKWAALRADGRDLGEAYVGEQWQGPGRFTVFQHGRVYWNRRTGAHELHGPIAYRFKRYGGVTSPLGFPVTDVGKSDVAGVERAGFVGGRIYWSDRTGARPILGVILDRYIKTGGPGGRLGLPTSPAYQTKQGRRQNFEHGTIAWISAKKRTVVTFTS